MEELLNETNAKDSFFGTICQIFGVVGLLISIFLGLKAVQNTNYNRNWNLLLITLTPAGSVAVTSAAVGSLGTTASQSKR